MRLPTSLVARVAKAVTSRGTATIDDLLPTFQDVTRSQLYAALCNARDAKLLHVKVRGHARTRRAAIWEPSPEPIRPMQPPASVWELASRREMPSAWPPSFENARQFLHLTDGDEIEEPAVLA